MTIRKLISFTSPPTFDWAKRGEYHIEYAYYDQDHRYTGKSEEIRLSEDELYKILKPYLKGTSHPQEP